MTGLDDDLRPIVGGRAATRLHKELGWTTVSDALHHYPRRYVERGELTNLRQLVVGDDVTVVADVRSIQRHPMSGRSRFRTEVVVTDGAGELRLTFFNHMDRAVQPGRRGLFAGRVSEFRGRLQLTHPEVEMLPDEAGTDAAEAFADQILPVYPLASKVGIRTLRNSMRLVVAAAAGLPDPIPSQVRLRHGLLPLADALRAIHFPESHEEIAAARRRLTWEEALLLQLVVLSRRAELRARPAVVRHPREGGLVAALDAGLPFALTAGQQEVAGEILADMACDQPMLRLLQGDVGSGKTVVALRAMLAAVDAGGQAALLAPTEVLAQQHYATIMDLLGPMARRGEISGHHAGTAVELLTGSTPAADRRRALLRTASGEAGVVVGTHALMSEEVMFADLALVVIDEQHRFGVEQRAALSAKTSGGEVPHTLVMTATPIPRTVAMTVFGDLDVSTLGERPALRAGIVTHVVPAVERPAYLARAWQRIREEVAAGRQAYIVCPRIDATGTAEPVLEGYVSSSAVELLEYLEAGPLAGLRLGLLHGRQPTAEKEAVMARFASGPAAEDGVDVLVATSVVEVGVDVPNASVMVIIDADRFGVSSLHQLRGRVGRGEHPGLCLLVTSAEMDSEAGRRLGQVAATDDGFAISRLDLRLRREGDVLGAVQSGRSSSLKLLHALDDADVIAEARSEAAQLLASDPTLDSWPHLGAAIARVTADPTAGYVDKA